MRPAARRVRRAAIPLGVVACLVVAAAIATLDVSSFPGTAFAVLLVALSIAFWLPLQWTSVDDSRRTQTAAYVWVGTAAALVSLPVAIILVTVAHGAGWWLSCRFGDGVQRAAYDVDAAIVNTSIGALTGLAAATAAQLVGSTAVRTPAMGAAVAALAAWVVASSVVASIYTYMLAGRFTELLTRTLRTGIAAAVTTAVGAAVVTSLVEELGPWLPVLVGTSFVVLLSRQAAKLHNYRTVTTTLLELATAAASATSVAHAVQLIEHSGRVLLGRSVQLSDRNPDDAPLEAAVATLPIGVDGWVIAVGEGQMGRPWRTGSFEVRALSGLGATAAVAILAARSREETHGLATRDPLTGLLNRRGFEGEAGRVVERARRDGRATTLAYIDLNGFKLVNDTLGHEAGDGVIAAVGVGLTRHLRPGDVAARMGGDEFAVVFADDLDDAAANQRIREALADLPHGVGGSVGIARGDADLDTLVREADARMYDAKGRRSSG